MRSDVSAWRDLALIRTQIMEDRSVPPFALDSREHGDVERLAKRAVGRKSDGVDLGIEAGVQHLERAVEVLIHRPGEQRFVVDEGVDPSGPQGA